MMHSSVPQPLVTTFLDSVYEFDYSRYLINVES